MIRKAVFVYLKWFRIVVELLQKYDLIKFISVPTKYEQKIKLNLSKVSYTPDT